MTVLSHCLPSGSLGTGELPVPHIRGTVSEPSGTPRGIVVLLHGLTTTTKHYPFDVDDAPTISFVSGLVGDDWVVLFPMFQEDNYVTTPCLGVSNDISNDVDSGERYLNSTLHWWDHVVNFLVQEYGDIPLVPFGISWGGWRTIQIAANRTSTITAYGAHAPAMVLSDVPSVWTAPADFTGLDTSGLDIVSTALDDVLVPSGIIGWGLNDSAVGHVKQEALYDSALAAGAPVEFNETNEDHTFSATDATTYLAWFTDVVDILAPSP